LGNPLPGKTRASLLGFNLPYTRRSAKINKSYLTLLNPGQGPLPSTTHRVNVPCSLRELCCFSLCRRTICLPAVETLYLTLREERRWRCL